LDVTEGSAAELKRKERHGVVKEVLSAERRRGSSA
jgi:hypothetical protein